MFTRTRNTGCCDKLSEYQFVIAGYGLCYPKKKKSFVAHVKIVGACDHLTIIRTWKQLVGEELS